MGISNDKKNWRIVGLILGGAAALVLVFGLGVFVGARGAVRFARVPLAPFARSPAPAPLPGHGAIGVISQIDENTIRLTDRLGQSQNITVGAATEIERGRGQHITLQELRVGYHIVVIGSPDAGFIRARFIRVVEAPPSNLKLPDKRYLLPPMEGG